MKISHSCRQDRPDGHIGVLHKRLVVLLTIFSACALAVLLAWCNSFEDPEQSSTDIDALKKLINLQFPYTSARWELVPTPELSGAVPGPTDYITLVAEIGPHNDQEFSSLPMAELFHPIPNTARSWMNAESRSLLSTSNAASSGRPQHSDCRNVTGILMRSSRTVTGHLCPSADRMLLYMVVVDHTISTP